MTDVSAVFPQGIQLPLVLSFQKSMTKNFREIDNDAPDSALWSTDRLEKACRRVGMRAPDMRKERGTSMSLYFPNSQSQQSSNRPGFIFRENLAAYLKMALSRKDKSHLPSSPWYPHTLIQGLVHSRCSISHCITSEWKVLLRGSWPTRLGAPAFLLLCAHSLTEGYFSPLHNRANLHVGEKLVFLLARMS